MKQPGRTNISPTSRSSVRLVAAWVITIFAVITLNLITSSQITAAMIEQRKQEIRRLVTLGLNAIEPVRQRYRTEKLTKEEALTEVRDIIRTMTYDDPETRNYLFMSSYEGTMLVQPFEPEKEGTDQWDLKDSYGTYIIRELVRQAREGPGFVEYYYHPPDRKAPELKISYVTGLDEFSCYLGTGLYVYDVKALMRGVFWKNHLAILFIFLGLGVLIFVLFRPYYIAYNLMHRRFSAVAEKPDVTFPDTGHRFGANSEVGFLIANFDSMLEELKLSREHIKKALSDKDVLLREIHHRVKNNLQIISSLLNLQTKTLKDPAHRHIFQESALRIHSMALIHETIYSSRVYDRVEMSEYIHSLAGTIFQSTLRPDAPVKQDFRLQQGCLNMDRAIICGLLLTELITNALKHGISAAGGGTLTLVYRQTDKDVCMEVADNGTGAPSDLLNRETESLGLTLVKSLTEQLDGSITFDNTEGSCFQITFPA